MCGGPVSWGRLFYRFAKSSNNTYWRSIGDRAAPIYCCAAAALAATALQSGARFRAAHSPPWAACRTIFIGLVAPSIPGVPAPHTTMRGTDVPGWYALEPTLPGALGFSRYRLDTEEYQHCVGHTLILAHASPAFHLINDPSRPGHHDSRHSPALVALLP